MRTKFKVDDVVLRVDGGSIHLSPVIEGSTENEDFFKILPLGGIELIYTDSKEFELFKPGQYFYVDFIETGV